MKPLELLEEAQSAFINASMMRKKDLTERENFPNSDEIELPQEKEDIPLSQQEEPIYRNLFNLEDYLKAIYEQENNHEKFKDSDAYSLKNEVKCNYIVIVVTNTKKIPLLVHFMKRESIYWRQSRR